MTCLNHIENIAGNQCRNCNRYAAAAENFCRWCGAQQTETATTGGVGWRHQTTILGNNEETPRPVSNRPLSALMKNVGSKTESLRFNRCGALVVAVLIAIPMWLLIILLSPFDAYVSAKTAYSQMDIR